MKERMRSTSSACVPMPCARTHHTPEPRKPQHSCERPHPSGACAQVAGGTVNYHTAALREPPSYAPSSVARRPADVAVTVKRSKIFHLNKRPPVVGAKTRATLITLAHDPNLSSKYCRRSPISFKTASTTKNTVQKMFMLLRNFVMPPDCPNDCGTRYGLQTPPCARTQQRTQKRSKVANNRAPL